jgi:hypothetical protein
VAVIYDDVARQITTGVYCRRALNQLVGVEHFGPGEPERIRRGRFDRNVTVDDGRRCRLEPWGGDGGPMA